MYKGWLKRFAWLYEITNRGRNVVYHCKNILLANISWTYMSHAGWLACNINWWKAGSVMAAGLAHGVPMLGTQLVGLQCWAHGL